VEKILNELKGGSVSGLDLSIVVPTLNESGNIGRVLEGICAQADKLGLKYEAFIVDGPSSDGTGKEAEAAGAFVVEEHSGGFGCAVRRSGKVFP
jgi:glycosyltransferase involved in cell wall biosynthesis